MLLVGTLSTERLTTTVDDAIISSACRLSHLSPFISGAHAHGDAGVTSGSRAVARLTGVDRRRTQCLARVARNPPLRSVILVVHRVSE